VIFRLTTLLFLFLSIGTCSNPKPPDNDNTVRQLKTETNDVAPQKTISHFDSILHSNEVRGAILIYDPIKNSYFSNDFEWASQRRIPASTFKIANSIIGLETKSVSDTTIFKWDGKPRRLSSWEKDMNLREAFHRSCVPCYQELARKIGPVRMKSYLSKFNYGKMILDSNTIDNFWLEGESGTSQFEQIHFLQNIWSETLPVSNTTLKNIKKIMVLDSSQSYVLSGKTGWAIRNGRNNGWFVGYVETNGSKPNIYYFATNIAPLAEFDMKLFPIIRSKITLQAFKYLEIIE